jgi:hypothetical protein
MKRNASQHRTALLPLLLISVVAAGSLSLSATVTAVSIQSPNLSLTKTTEVTSPVHFAATAESNEGITGYVVYLDGNNVYQNSSPAMDAWILLPPKSGKHSVYIEAWDKSGSGVASSTYSIQVRGVAAPVAPANATRLVGIDKPAEGTWVVDNNNNVGGECNTGSIGTWNNNSDPNTANSPDYDENGQHFVLDSKCTYDDSLFFWKNPGGGQPSTTNFLWDFWIYIPNSTSDKSVQALEFDLFQAVSLSQGVHEFMFGSQCNYATNQWQFWLPKGSGLTWVNGGLSPCQFSTGQWHHLTYFYQRVTTSGYQVIPATFSSSTDTNSDVRFGTLTIDGDAMYIGGLAYSTSSSWNPVLGIQHQLDSAESGFTIEQYDDEESLTTW